jgi:transposase InsO family protein
MNPWRAGCAETCKSGSEGGPRKRTGRNPDTAPRPDPYTYLPTWEGWLYLAAVQDAFSRRIVGWSMADHMRAELVVDALQMGVARRRPEAGLVHHSDQGSQYVSLTFGQQAGDAGIAVSMGSKGDCFDNAVAESFFATIKKELINRRAWKTRRELSSEVFEYIETFYNRSRRHSTLNYLSLEDYESNHDKNTRGRTNQPNQACPQKRGHSTRFAFAKFPLARHGCALHRRRYIG